MTTKKTPTEDEMIDAELAAIAATEAKRAGLSINTLRQIVETIDRIKGELATLATLTSRVLMPAAPTAFRPFGLWNGRSATVLDLTRNSAQTMLETAEALTAPKPDAED